jgi:hypothetical protein
MTANNVPRKVKILPSNSKRHIGFRQQCYSVLLMTTKNGTWLGEGLHSDGCINTDIGIRNRGCSSRRDQHE